MAEGSKGDGAGFALMLPVEGKIFESYVVWMEELVKHVEISSIYKADSLANYIKLILEGEKKDRLNEEGEITSGEVTGVDGVKSVENEDDDNDWKVSTGCIAVKLNAAAMYTYLGDFTSAMAHLKYIDKGNLDKLGLQECQRQVIEYFRDSLSWSIGVLKGCENAKDGSDLSIVIRESVKLNTKWEELEHGDNKVKATMAFTKATKLDPECHFWYHYAYRTMRRIRRNVKPWTYGTYVRLFFFFGGLTKQLRGSKTALKKNIVALQHPKRQILNDTTFFIIVVVNMF